MRGQPDKVTQNGVAVAQLIWPEDHLVQHQIGPFVHVGSRFDPDGEKVVIAGKVRGRKSGRGAVSQEDSNLFSGIESVFYLNLSFYRLFASNPPKITLRTLYYNRIRNYYS